MNTFFVLYTVRFFSMNNNIFKIKLFINFKLYFLKKNNASEKKSFFIFQYL